MNFLGIGPLELVLIIILALIFLGPEDMQVMARKLAQWWREVQRLSQEANTWFQEELEPELREFRQLKEELAEGQKAVHQLNRTLQDPVKTLTAESEQKGEQQTSASPAQTSAQVVSPLPVASRPLAPPDNTTGEKAAQEET